jgi:2-keto-4-pentenoate hydratase/2-oxohepta-3-ene-1,7-dioic acid hydratase in catechol pathway
MIKRMSRYLGMFGLALITVIVAAWLTSSDPKLNQASFEKTPLVEGLAPFEHATTLAQFIDEDGRTVTVQVIDYSGETITGINLAELGGSPNDNPLLAFASISTVQLNAANVDDFPAIKVEISDLLPSGTLGSSHLGTGTNFPEHAEEAGSQSVFNFPKFGKATAARTEVAAKPGVLLDYEVELCIRFDRDIETVMDFDTAVKGLFLCGDFTNRNALVELVDPDNLDSGHGFSDSKSGPDFFPTGPFIVVPKDLASFVSNLRMTTSVNQQARQDARGGEMTLDFRQLAEKSLADMSQQRFLYADEFHYLAPHKRIDSNMTLMSGTAEGVIFTPPTRRDLIEGVVHYLAAGGPLSNNTLIESVKQTFISNELNSGHYLQPGDVVEYHSSYLGNINIRVTE